MYLNIGQLKNIATSRIAIKSLSSTLFSFIVVTTIWKL